MGRDSNITGREVQILLLLVVLTGLALTAGEGELNAVAAEINISNTGPVQGEVIDVKTPSGLAGGYAVLAGDSYPLRLDGDEGRAMIPVSYWLEPGEYTLSVFSEEGSSLSKWSIDVQAGDFPTSYIDVDEEMARQLEPEDPEKQARRERERELVHKARSTSSESRFWEGDFQWPLEGRITTEFGATRYHNDELANRHNGIDIAAPAGKDIEAAAAGQVRLARDLLSTGRTVIIDHGWDVFSSYLHMVEIEVEQGDSVNKGDTIGYVGESGFATGPHLHWSVSIGRTFVDPREFMGED